MTAVETTVAMQWGVCYTTHSAGRHVDVKPSEAAARSWLAAVEFCGNRDAVLVARAAPDAAWIPVGGAL